jgi:hypothetical protein
MPADASPASRPRPVWREFALAFVLYAVVIGFLFRRSFSADFVHFNNDGPLGAVMALADVAKTAFFGLWQPFTWVGGEMPAALPNLTILTYFALGPIGYAKFYAPVSLLLLGLSAWYLFRRLRFSPTVCILGGLAAALNMNTFSNACWGLAGRANTLAMVFLALAALVSGNGWRAWARTALAGLATGMAVMEGADGGAIFSLYVAAFVLFQAWVGEGAWAARARKGALRLAVVTLFAALIAARALVVMVGTQVVGVVGMAQDLKTKAQRWDEATQWSLPKIETLRVAIPGLFGYRMDTPNGGNYWGAVGQTPGWEKHHQGMTRHSGSGEYAGVLVVLVALWALVHSLRKTNNPFPELHRRFIWFWATMAGISLLLAWGRHAPFYQFVYALPYFSTIRNPIKFLHPFHGAVLILFAYGLHGLGRRYLGHGSVAVLSLKEHLKAWWTTAPVPDKKWTTGSLLAVGASVLGWMLFASSGSELHRHLRAAGFDATNFPGVAEAIARFSLGEVGLFAVFLAASVALLTLALSGWFAGARSKWAGVLLGALLLVDLGRANLPWIQHYDYKVKYATNPVFEFLRQNTHEGRVTVLPFNLGEQFAVFQQLYGVEWLQHQFQYYRIQAFDIIQEPRETIDNNAFRRALPRTNVWATLRSWELTNTRYLFGLAGEFVRLLNEQIDPGRNRFRVHTPFALYQDSPSGPLRAQITTNGPFALLEFTGALPRAKLFANWRVSTNDEATLQELANPAFDPHQTVLVANELPAPSSGASTNADAGTVSITRYSPKEIELRAAAKAPCVLLLNDKFHPSWKVWVDERPTPLLRCNFLMRGVQLSPNDHTIVFRFQPPTTGLWLSAAAILFGLVLCGVLIVTERGGTGASEQTASLLPEGQSQAAARSLAGSQQKPRSRRS